MIIVKGLTCNAYKSGRSQLQLILKVASKEKLRDCGTHMNCDGH